MRTVLFSIVLFLLVLPGLLMAGELKKTADLGLTFNQSGYSASWTGDELGTLTWAVTGNLVLEKELGAKMAWKNDLKLSYGQTHLEVEGDDGDRSWAQPEKSSDRVFNESLLKITLGKFVDPYLALTFDSQFHDADNHPLNPSLLAESAGVGRMLIKNEQTEFFTRVGVAVRQRMGYFVSTVTDGGIESVTDFSRTFGEGDLKVVSKLRLFQAFINSQSDDLAGLASEEYWKSPDVAWETTFSASVSKYIQTTLFVEFLYDKEIEKRGRLREVLGLGVAYKMF